MVVDANVSFGQNQRQQLLGRNKKAAIAALVSQLIKGGVGQYNTVLNAYCTL
ncbi:hypothetical protein [Deefgea piscis]|uniref:hypothetical protein n=1 Tax=Deefgea piscis TaxID=2739061 RepID=UPI001C7E9079|nr:hypothetical protein [Deefgea piscis]QZA80932.1 hypothetical protein K4H25_15825 [Deefgea piscis]